MKLRGHLRLRLSQKTHISDNAYLKKRQSQKTPFIENACCKIKQDLKHKDFLNEKVTCKLSYYYILVGRKAFFEIAVF